MSPVISPEIHSRQTDGFNFMQTEHNRASTLCILYATSEFRIPRVERMCWRRGRNQLFNRRARFKSTSDPKAPPQLAATYENDPPPFCDIRSSRAAPHEHQPLSTPAWPHRFTWQPLQGNRWRSALVWLWKPRGKFWTGLRCSRPVVTQTQRPRVRDR